MNEIIDEERRVRIEMNAPENRRGRPPIVAGKLKKELHAWIPQEDWELLYFNLKGKTIAEALSYLIRSIYSVDGKISMLKQEEAELTAQLAVKRSQILVEEEKEKERKKRAAIEEIEQRYPGMALKHLISQTVKLSPSAKSITTKPEFIEQRYGIKFDIDKLNKDFSELVSSYQDIPDIVLSTKYHCVRTGQGERAGDFVPPEYLDLIKQRSW
jgi:hypothetical protein